MFNLDRWVVCQAVTTLAISYRGLEKGMGKSVLNFNYTLLRYQGDMDQSSIPSQITLHQANPFSPAFILLFPLQLRRPQPEAAQEAVGRQTTT